MEISLENFTEKLPLVRSSISTCDFVAFDTEFSGSKVTLDDKPHEFDTFRDKYARNSRACKSFLAFQVGITTFKWSSLKGKYIGRPFNFNIFPRSVIDPHRNFHVNVSLLLISLMFWLFKITSIVDFCDVLALVRHDSVPGQV